MAEIDYSALGPDDPLLAELFDPDVEWLPAGQSTLAAEVYRGYAGVARFWADIFSAWEEYALEPLELVDLDDRVAVVARIRARTRQIEIDERWSALCAFRDGRIVRFQGFASPEGALEAARQT
jgi:ketosteroid isomerase-like protein